MILSAPTLAEAAAEIVRLAEPPRRRHLIGYDITQPDDPRHGSKAGYDAHRRANTDACDRCLRGAARSAKTYEVAAARGQSFRHPECTVKRRLQALVAMGYSYSHLDREFNSERHVWNWCNKPVLYYPRDTYLRVRAVYDRLSMTPPVPGNAREATEIRRAKERAAAQGWVPPLGWDDNTIDDPTAVPYDGADIGAGVMYGGTTLLEVRAKAAKVLDCNDRQLTIHAACRELGVTRRALEKWTRLHDGPCRILTRCYSEMVDRQGEVWANQTGKGKVA